MADPASYRPRDVPTAPGVYRFRDSQGRVLYVGKAKNLRSRLASYFQDPERLHPRTRSMVTTASSVQWTVVANEVEALSLEYTWIKEFSPRFNVVFRDDKSYPYLAVSLGEEYPRVQVMRGELRKDTRYFGPYTHAWAIRETMDLLLRVFPVRSCSMGVFRRARNSGRPCLLGYIDKCSAPCVGRISPQAHRALAEDLCAFMNGDAARFITRLERQMLAAADAQDYERAGRLRDDIAALRRVMGRNAVVLPADTDADVYAIATDELQASVQVFHVRQGRIRGQRGWVTDRGDDASEGELIERLLVQVHGPQAQDDGTAGHAIPREILVPHLPDDVEALAAWLRAARGGVVSIRVPRRGDKRALQDTVHENAVQALDAEKLRRGADLATRSRALEELQRHLGLAVSPLRIECYDISHTGGTLQVGSMVVFEDGLPKKRDYRTFNIRGPEGDGARDDTEALAEVLARRFEKVRRGPAPTSGVAEDIVERESFSYEPGLLVIDGGLPQASVAARTLAGLGVDVPVVSLAKRLEEVWVPGEDFPVVLPRGSEALHLLQRVRDEAHRFAITRHRKRRSKAMTDSVLDTLPGIGPARAKALLKHFGSVRRLRQADEVAIAQVPGIGPALAREIVAHFAKG
ncbi:MAG: excinuclease ABC subunit UvrC [Actinomycetota bacterium]